MPTQSSAIVTPHLRNAAQVATYTPPDPALPPSAAGRPPPQWQKTHTRPRIPSANDMHLLREYTRNTSSTQTTTQLRPRSVSHSMNNTSPSLPLAMTSVTMTQRPGQGPHLAHSSGNPSDAPASTTGSISKLALRRHSFPSSNQGTFSPLTS
jgi:hypothetical protein